MSRPKGSAQKLESRRRRAVQMVRSGKKPSDVARSVGVDRISVYRWINDSKKPGGLNPKPR